MFNFENSITPIASICNTRFDMGDPDPNKINVVLANEWSEFLDQWDKFATVSSLYKTVIIDSLTAANQLVLEYVLRRSSVNPKELQHPQFQDFRNSYHVMRNLFLDIQREEALNFILICHAKQNEGDFKKELHLQGNELPRVIRSLTDHVGYLDVSVKGDRVLTFKPSSKHESKARQEGNFNMETSVFTPPAPPEDIVGNVSVLQIAKTLKLTQENN